MPIYDLICTDCGASKDNAFVEDYYHHGQRLVSPNACDCGSHKWQRKGIGLPADMSAKWKHQCRKAPRKEAR